MSSSRSRPAGGARRTMHPNLPGRPECEHPPFRVPPSLAGPKRVFVACHACGYGPPAVPEDGLCPKCGGHSWERFAVSTRLLPEAQTKKAG